MKLDAGASSVVVTQWTEIRWQILVRLCSLLGNVCCSSSIVLDTDYSNIRINAKLPFLGIAAAIHLDCSSLPNKETTLKHGTWDDLGTSDSQS